MGFDLKKLLQDGINTITKPQPATTNIAKVVGNLSDRFNPLDRQFQQRVIPQVQREVQQHITQPVNDYFKPTTQLRARDFVREVPNGIAQTPGIVQKGASDLLKATISSVTNPILRPTMESGAPDNTPERIAMLKEKGLVPQDYVAPNVATGRQQEINALNNTQNRSFTRPYDPQTQDKEFALDTAKSALNVGLGFRNFGNAKNVTTLGGVAKYANAQGLANVPFGVADFVGRNKEDQTTTNLVKDVGLNYGAGAILGGLPGLTNVMKVKGWDIPLGNSVKDVSKSVGKVDNAPYIETLKRYVADGNKLDTKNQKILDDYLMSQPTIGAKPSVAESILNPKVDNALGKPTDQAAFEASQLADLNKIAPDNVTTISTNAIPKKKSPININAAEQLTTNKVEAPKITGETLVDRIGSARANSENIRQQIVQRGQDAYIAGQKLNDAELKVIRDAYQSGKSIDEIANASSNPKVVKNYLEKLSDYYDFELAADRAVGGTTIKESNHLRQIWDLSDPAKKAQFDELAKQRGLDNYSGYGAQPKVFKSYAEGEALGFKPKNRNINEDLLSHSRGASEAIGKRQLVNGLREAAPDQVTAAGMGRTAEGKAFENLNIRGMEDVAVSPEVAAQLKGYTPLKGAAGPDDFIANAKRAGKEGSRNVGVGQYVDNLTGTIKAIPKSAKEAGFKGVAGSLYDHSSQELKKILLNMSFFHVLNVGETNLGRIVSHPVKGTRSMLQAIGSLPSEKVTQANIKYYKSKVIPGTNMSVFDAALASGQNMTRGLPVKGAEKLNPLGVTGRATFDRFIYTLQMGLNDQIFGNGKIRPDSPQGRALGKEIELAVGKLNQITNNIDPNTMKWFSRGMLAPQYTASKYKMLWDSVSKWGKVGSAKMSQGNFARSTVAGEAFAVGTIATLGTLIATGEFPELNQILMNYTFDPRIETNMKNAKGENIDIKTPKTFLSEPGGIIVPAVTGNTWGQKTEGLVHAGQSRLNPILADTAKILTNKNYYGENVVPTGMNPIDSAKTMVADILQGRTPIGAQSILRAIEGKDTLAQAAIGILGARTTTSKDAPSQRFSNAYDLQKQIQEVQTNLEKGKITPEDAQRTVNDLTQKMNAETQKLAEAQGSSNGVTFKPGKGSTAYLKNDGTFGWAKNEEDLKKQVSKQEFERSGKNFMEKDGMVYRRNEDGTVKVQTKDKYSYELGTAKLEQYKKADNVTKWMETAQGQLQNIVKQLKDPSLDEVEVIKLQNDAQTLMDNMDKYTGYGGFTKGKNKASMEKMIKLLETNTSSNMENQQALRKLLKNIKITRKKA